MAAAQTPVVGFIGLGAIGSPMAERLVHGGAEVVVFNRSPGPTRRFEGRARIAQSPAEVAERADHVFLCLTNAESYRSVVLGEQGLVHGKRWQTYVHTGTNEVAVVTDMEKILKAHGVATIDSPVTGGVSGAERGVLTAMAAGPRDAWERVKPFVQHYASKLVYLGEVAGTAQTMKLVNNLLSAANLALASEAVVLGAKAGLDGATMLEVLNSGSGQNSATLTKLPNAILTRKFNHGAKLEAMIKDLAAFKAEAEKLDLAIPLATAVLACFVEAADQEGQDADVTAVIRPMERRAQVTVS
jgi:2-hydroxy-3-oxopropionate reductase